MGRVGAQHELRLVPASRPWRDLHPRHRLERPAYLAAVRHGRVVSVAGIAPAYLVRETRVLLLDDTDRSGGLVTFHEKRRTRIDVENGLVGARPVALTRRCRRAVGTR